MIAAHANGHTAAPKALATPAIIAIGLVISAVVDSAKSRVATNTPTETQNKIFAAFRIRFAALVRRRRNDGFLQHHLEPVGEALQQAEGADDIGPAPQHDRGQHLAVDIDDHRHRQHQRQGDQQDPPRWSQ